LRHDGEDEVDDVLHDVYLSTDSPMIPQGMRGDALTVEVVPPPQKFAIPKSI